jgi:hypothetical protein
MGGHNFAEEFSHSLGGKRSFVGTRSNDKKAPIADLPDITLGGGRRRRRLAKIAGAD